MKFHSLGRPTVGSGFARNLWSVRRVSKDDLPTAASPVQHVVSVCSVTSDRTGMTCYDKLENVVPCNAGHSEGYITAQIMARKVLRNLIILTSEWLRKVPSEVVRWWKGTFSVKGLVVIITLRQRRSPDQRDIPEKLSSCCHHRSRSQHHIFNHYHHDCLENRVHVRRPVILRCC